MPMSGREAFSEFSQREDQITGPDGGALMWCPGEETESSSGLKRDLARTIETEIIPRLMLAHRANEAGRAAIPHDSRPAEAFSEIDVDRFAQVVVRQPLQAARRYIDSLRQDGMSAEIVVTVVLANTARHLGKLWEQDRCSFVDVSVGLTRLQQLLRIYGPSFELEQPPRQRDGRILLAAVPGEQHTFGLSVVDEFFRRAQWDVQSEYLPSRVVLVERVRSEWFDVIGLSASGEVTSAQISDLIHCLRDAALNRHVHIILGGCLFVDDPSRAVALGADSGARDAAEALTNVEHVLDAKMITC